MSYFHDDGLWFADSYACSERIKRGLCEGSVINRPLDIESYDSNVINCIPSMVGTHSKALQESHIFFLPVLMLNKCLTEHHELDKDENEPYDLNYIVSYYTQLVEKFNKHVQKFSMPFKFKEMKAPVLALNFKDIGYVTVLQSSMYILSDDINVIIKMTHQMANYFASAGFTVVREKIEASAYGINGIPMTDEEAQMYDKYFEFHIRVGRKDATVQSTEDTPLTEDEVLQLENVSTMLSDKFGIPVPLSYNKAKEVGGKGYQRYLNVRFRQLGLNSIKEKLNEINVAIVELTCFKVIKTISEYVWYDTYVELDKGWIDF
jgi:hypothetical protein